MKSIKLIIIQIKSDCKYLVPLHIQQLWDENKHLYTQSLSPTTSDVVVVEGSTNDESSTDDEPKVELSEH